MSMKISRLYTHWTAEETDTVVAFLVELRYLLWDNYGEQIIEMRCNASMETGSHKDQTDWIEDDEIDF